MMEAKDFAGIHEALDSQGMCILNSCKPGDAEAIANSLGKIVGETDVTIKHEDRRGPMVTSDRALDIHTDHHDVKFVIWYCVKNSSSGGYSLLSDFNKFSHALTPEDIDVLKSVFLYEHDVFNSGNKSAPMLRVDEDGRIKIYFSFWLVDANDKNKDSVKLFYKLAKQNISRHKLSEGDVLIINNHRILHGRTAITGDKKRHLRRFWVA